VFGSLYAASKTSGANTAYKQINSFHLRSQRQRNGKGLDSIHPPHKVTRYYIMHAISLVLTFLLKQMINSFSFIISIDNHYIALCLMNQTVCTRL